MTKHSELTVIHRIYNWTYADAAARTGASGFVAADIGKIAWQLDDDTLWMLKATTPTWVAFDPGGAPSSNEMELDYVEFTSNVSPTATTEATANTVVTGSAVAYDGSTVVIIEFFSPNARPDTGAAARTMTLWLYDGASSIGQIGLLSTPAANINNVPVHCVRRITPSNASHTYSIRASVSAGTGLVAAGAGGAGNNAPGFIRIIRAKGGLL